MIIRLGRVHIDVSHGLTREDSVDHAAGRFELWSHRAVVTVGFGGRALFTRFSAWPAAVRAVDGTFAGRRWRAPWSVQIRGLMGWLV